MRKYQTSAHIVRLWNTCFSAAPYSGLGSARKSVASPWLFAISRNVSAVLTVAFRACTKTITWQLIKEINILPYISQCNTQWIILLLNQTSQKLFSCRRRFNVSCLQLVSLFHMIQISLVNVNYFLPGVPVAHCPRPSHSKLCPCHAAVWRDPRSWSR